MKKYYPNTELNRCKHCNKDFPYPEVCVYWKCPICNETLSLKIEINNRFYSVSILYPPDLQIGDQVTLGNNFIHRILAIEKNDCVYRIALKDYTAITMTSNDQMAVINGSWYN